MRKFRALAFISILAFSACEKLPRETTSGKQTFGCRVDGKIWNTYNEHLLDREIEPEYQTGYIAIQAERDTRNSSSRFYLQLYDTLGLRTRTYAGWKEGFQASYTTSEDNADLYITDTTDAGATLTITHFTPPPAPGENAIISGTFSFTLYSPNTGKKINVTDGRFDIKAQ